MTRVSPIITKDLYDRFVSVFQSKFPTKPLLYNELVDLFQQVSDGLDSSSAQDELNKLLTGRFRELSYIKKDILLSVRYQRDQAFHLTRISDVLVKHNIDVERLENFI